MDTLNLVVRDIILLKMLKTTKRIIMRTLTMRPLAS